MYLDYGSIQSFPQYEICKIVYSTEEKVSWIATQPSESESNKDFDLSPTACYVKTIIKADRCHSTISEGSYGKSCSVSHYKIDLSSLLVGFSH